MDMLENSVFFGVMISLVSYAIGMWLKRKTGWALMNPLFVSIVLVIATLLLFNISYDSYKQGSNIITYLLTPATVCLAVPLYQQVELLKRNFKALMAGMLAGVLASLGCILLMALLLGLDHATYVTFLPKSITTAIGIGVSEELGGIVPVTVVCIVVTGVLGNVFAEKFLKIIHVTNPIAKGIAIGSAAHAVGTAKAMEMGAVEGSMSSLSIVVCGIMTVVLASLFAMIA